MRDNRASRNGESSLNRDCLCVPEAFQSDLIIQQSCHYLPLYCTVYLPLYALFISLYALFISLYSLFISLFICTVCLYLYALSTQMSSNIDRYTELTRKSPVSCPAR